ncbi:DinB family protein [Rhodospirillaceae bacterium SYSU D60014]|uniref:DinB family protein n=1 Tax=Virgifigura deserti TaxID=2268457 RepID=UPI000E674FC3
MIEQFRAMARNNVWSNHRLLNACAKLSDTEYRAKRVSFFPSIHLTLNHILIIDWYYIDALTRGGKGPALYADQEPFAQFADLAEAQRDSDLRLVGFCDGLDDAAVGGTVELVRSEGRRYVETTDRVLCHLFTHQTHHRGQVHAMLSGTSIAPPQLDEFFLAQDAGLRAEEMRALDFIEPTL